MRKVIENMFGQTDIRPVLIDIGSAGAPPGIWKHIRRYSTYVGFDPDSKETSEIQGGSFYKTITVNKAIASGKQSDEVLFYFTKSPHCSSTLNPDTGSLSNYLFSDLFTVETESKVPVVTLDSVMDNLSLPQIDWLKIDSQGTDLRIFSGLSDKLRSRVLAVDIEPGLIDAYIGEDLFVDAHRYLTSNGFWLSNLNIYGAVRMRRSAMREIAKINKNISYRFVNEGVKKSPGWCEARYFRTINFLNEEKCSKREYALLWAFTILDKQFGFAVDLGIEYERIFGRDKISQAMKEGPISLMRRFRISHRIARFLKDKLK